MVRVSLWISKCPAQPCVTEPHRMCRPLPLPLPLTGQAGLPPPRLGRYYCPFSTVASGVGLQVVFAVSLTASRAVSADALGSSGLPHFPVPRQKALSLCSCPLEPQMSSLQSSQFFVFWFFFEAFAFLVIIFSKQILLLIYSADI